jgi:hypothetical protein
MNKLEIEVDLYEDGGEATLGADCRIDGEPIAPPSDATSLHGLHELRQEHSGAFVLTCTCGVPGCAGYTKGFRAAFTEETVTWVDNDGSRSWTFEREPYERELDLSFRRANELVTEAKARGVPLHDWDGYLSLIGVRADAGEPPRWLVALALMGWSLSASRPCSYASLVRGDARPRIRRHAGSESWTQHRKRLA